MTAVTSLGPDELRMSLANDEVFLVDVREPFESASARISGARLAPLGRLNASEIRAEAGARSVVFYCRSGRRSEEAAQVYSETSGGCTFLDGGIEAWTAAGLPTVRDASAPRLDVMRQVQVVAGSLVLIGVVIGLTVTPWALGLSAFVGAGLVFAGASGWCGMAKLLGALPWNRVRTPA